MLYAPAFWAVQIDARQHVLCVTPLLGILFEIRLIGGDKLASFFFKLSAHAHPPVLLLIKPLIKP